MINGVPFGTSYGFFAGLAATNAMTVAGITSSDNLLAVISWASATGATPNGRDISDFTVADGTLTAGTIDLSSTTCIAIWTSAPSS